MFVSIHLCIKGLLMLPSTRPSGCWIRVFKLSNETVFDKDIDKGDIDVMVKYKDSSCNRSIRLYKV